VFAQVLFFMVLLAFSLLFSFLPRFSDFFVFCSFCFSALLGSFFSGFITVFFLKKNGLFFGALAGIFYCFLVTFVGFVLYGCGFSVYLITRFLFSAFVAALGGIVSVNR